MSFLGQKLVSRVFFHGCEQSCEGRPGYEATAEQCSKGTDSEIHSNMHCSAANLIHLRLRILKYFCGDVVAKDIGMTIHKSIEVLFIDYVSYI